MSDPRDEHEHPHADEQEPAGSGTSQRGSEAKRQAGSYSRDAEQDPDATPESTHEQRE
jgi:hypothetical protein